jgi:hypothetical protein
MLSWPVLDEFAVDILFAVNKQVAWLTEQRQVFGLRSKGGAGEADDVMHMEGSAPSHCAACIRRLQP